MKNLLITLLLFQFTFALAQDLLTPCEQAQANATGLIGEFVPQCEEDGSYSSIQCWGSTGDCWCVDEYGIEIPGTTSSPGQGMPDCASTIDACTLSPDPGNCLAAIQMYYFNQETQQCEDFTWGGCGGVVPFESLAECEAALCAQSGDNCCINPDWINPMAICPWVYDPVIGCDGIEYSNSCFAQAAGVSSWIDQVGSETVLNWDCGGNPVDLCTSPSGVEIFVEGFWQNPADPCEMGECISTGEFVQIIVDCAEEMGLACDGEWVEVEGQCCSECVPYDNSYCDSINLNPILPLSGLWDDSVLVVNIQTTYLSNYSIPYAGIMLIDAMGDTIALESMSTAGNVYGIFSNMSETRELFIVNELVFPFTGELCVVEGLFAGDPNIVCSYPVMWNNMELYQIQIEEQPKLLRMIDILGREQNIHQSGQLLFYIYDNGFVEKLIKY